MEKKDFYDFQSTAKIVNRYLRTESENLSLSFKGYNDLLIKHFSLQDNNFEDIYFLTREFNFWTNYISEMQNVIQYKRLQYLDEMEILKGDLDKYVLNTELDDKINGMKIKIRYFSIFSKQLEAQKNFFNKAYFYYLKSYSKNMKFYEKISI